MRLTPRLVARLYRAFIRDPGSTPDIVFTATDDASWQIADEAMTLTIGSVTTTWDLTAYTLFGFALELRQQPNITVTQVPTAARQGIGAIVLVDGSTPAPITAGSPVTLAGYTRLSWAFQDTAAKELTLARAAVEAAPGEIALNTADGSWVDLHGTYYDIPRNPGESDDAYSSRIAFQILLPCANNVSIEIAIQRYLGLTTQVVDVTVYTQSEPMFDGVPKFDGTYEYDPASYPIYGMFDVRVQAPSVTAAQQASIRSICASLAGSGNALRNIVLV